MISPTFLGGPVEIFAKTMVLSTFGAGGPRDLGTMEQWFGCFSLGGTGTMEQWFDQLLGPGVPVIWEQWNNGLDVFHWGGPEQWNNGLTNFWGRGSP